MLINVTKKIVPFLVVYLVVVFYFSVMFAQTDKYGESFISSAEDFKDFPPLIKGVLATWNLGLGSMDYTFSTGLGASVYFVGTLLSVIVMLNILISVVSDVYDEITMQRVKLDIPIRASLLYDLATMGSIIFHDSDVQD